MYIDKYSYCRQNMPWYRQHKRQFHLQPAFFPLWLPSNVLISVLVLSLIPQETVVGQELPVFTAAHIKEGLTT